MDSSSHEMRVWAALFLFLAQQSVSVLHYLVFNTVHHLYIMLLLARYFDEMK